MIPVSDAKEETNRQSNVRNPVLITALPDDSYEEEEDTASLRDLMKSRKKALGAKETGPSQPVVNLPPPPPQLPTNLETKPIPDPKKKRPITDSEAKVVPPKGAKQ